ncbi:MAG: cysteine desulfurase [Planctomycetia bacterium]|nr:cysteine desulfurase [Planctomycetia bacterium]
MTDRIYFDYNATTPCAPEVAAAMRTVLEDKFGNPSSLHWAGEPARAAIDHARRQVAAMLGSRPGEIVFTSGGTEANNHAIKGAFFACRDRTRQPHFVTSSVEHPSVEETCAFIESLGAAVMRVRVDRFGQVDPDDVRKAMRRETVLVSVMHANNEVGTIQPIREIVQIAHEGGAIVHTDAAQTIGKMRVDVRSLGVDLVTVAAHKFYGPKGVGALYVREGVQLEPCLHGAGHEAGRRAGTENVLAIVGLGAASELATQWIDRSDVLRLRDLFWQLLRERFGDSVVLNGHPDERLANTLNVSFRGRIGHELLSRLSGVAASTGSACHAGSHEMSPVLRAMGVAEPVGLGAIRFSLGRTSTQAEVENVVEQLASIVR